MTAVAVARPIDRFVEVSSAKIVKRAIASAVRLVGPVRIVGRPGVGKSAALLHYRETFGASYCECTGFAKDIRGLFQTLVAALEISTDARTSRELADIVYAVCSPRRNLDGVEILRPLLVDEWQTLEPPAQRELLRLAETCRIPLVLCGNAERLFTTRTHRAAIAQIESRIAAQYEVPGLSPEDCDSISIDFNVEGKEAWALVRRLGAALEFRGLTNVLREAAAVTGGRGSIQLRHLELAMHSLNAWSKVEKPD
jgi:DNA transposition AAA+ family ATPase